jgi:hypothetical protein
VTAPASSSSSSSDGRRPRRRRAAAAVEDVAVDATVVDAVELAQVAIARCPFSGDVVTMSIDTSGLGGPWWDYEAPSRPVDAMPPTVFCVTGAMRLGSPIEATDHLVMPGPEVPFVVKNLIADRRIKAVITRVAVGAHTAWPITYFAKTPLPSDLARFNTWGTDRSWYLNADEQFVWWQEHEDFADLDYDLTPWVKSGKLSWIAPGDDGVTLSTDVASCPYVGLEGHRAFTRVMDGEAWWPPDR